MKIQQPRPINQANKEELLRRYELGKIWLEQHEPTQKDPSFDMQGNLFDEEKYEKALKILEQIETELNSRFPDWGKVDQSKINSMKAGVIGIEDLSMAETKEYFNQSFPGFLKDDNEEQ